MIYSLNICKYEKGNKNNIEINVKKGLNVIIKTFSYFYSLFNINILDDYLDHEITYDDLTKAVFSQNNDIV